MEEEAKETHFRCSHARARERVIQVRIVPRCVRFCGKKVQSYKVRHSVLQTQ